MKDLLNRKEYEFLKTNEHLGDNIILLALGGSHAYGTNVEGSDIDLRGCALNKADEILTNKNFEQVVEKETDTVIYSFNKIVHLLSNCNPNVIEILGCNREHYLYVSEKGRELLNHGDLFLSQRAIASFGGYAVQQLRKLENKSNKEVDQETNERHILDTLNVAMEKIKENKAAMPDDGIKIYMDDAENNELDKEIYLDIRLTHYPARDYKNILSDIKAIIKSYEKNKSGDSEISRKDLAKNMMHLIRSYYMCEDILTKKKVITYREKEHDLLMDIRNQKYLNQDNKPISEFYELLEDCKKRLEYAKVHTELPENPDYNKINEFLYGINLGIVMANK